MSDKVNFQKRISIEQVEEGTELAPKFDESGLIPCVTTSAKTGEVLMLGYMNKEALEKTILTGEAHYFSRSRQVLWHKGANSGFIQKVKDLRIDDDQDAVWLNVELVGKEASCHVGYRSCFYRSIPTADERKQGDALIFKEEGKTFDPLEVYGDVPNPTKL
jgi:phosphoribosyl-AMP cyclohydrolase